MEVVIMFIQLTKLYPLMDGDNALPLLILWDKLLKLRYLKLAKLLQVELGIVVVS